MAAPASNHSPSSILFPDNATVAERLRAFRKRAGFSQDGLAHAMGVNEWTVKYWENGRRRPDETRLKLLIETVGMSHAERLQLFRRIDEERKGRRGRHSRAGRKPASEVR